MAFSIDVGPGAADRATWRSAATDIDLHNPANLSGHITSIDIWAFSNMSGVIVGTFFFVSGNGYQCRSAFSIGNVTSGSKQTFPVFMPIVKGDYIGVSFTGGQIEATNTGLTGLREAAAGHAVPGDLTNYSYIGPGNGISLYGQGYVPAWGKIPHKLVAVGLI